MVEISCFDRGGISCSSLTLFLDGDPAIDLGMQNIQGQGTAADDLVVKGAKIEFVAQLLASFLAQAQNFQLPQLVRQSVPGLSPFQDLTATRTATLHPAEKVIAGDGFQHSA